MESDDNLMQHLHGGFKLSLDMAVVSNIKDAVLELLVDDEEEQKWQGILLSIAPVLLLQITGSVDIKFEEFEELLAHPMAAMLQASLKDMYEGNKGKSIQAAMAEKVLVDKLEPSEYYETQVGMMKQVFGFCD